MAKKWDTALKKNDFLFFSKPQQCLAVVSSDFIF